MKLTGPERLLIAQIVNVNLDNSTLKEHILLENIYNKVKPEDVKLPQIVDFVKSDKEKKLLEKYDGVKISEIESEEDRKTIQEIMVKFKENELKFWSNQDKDNDVMDVNFTKEQISVIMNFYEKDKRPFPREYHKVIIDLYNKLSGAGEF